MEENKTADTTQTDTVTMSDAQIAALLSVPDLTECKKVLCIQPHADDNEIGMGGIIAKLAKAHCIIHYLTVTDGRLGDANTGLTPDQLADTRRKEAEAAGRLLGAEKFFWFDYPDGTLTNIPELSRKVAALIRQEGYDSIFCPDPWLSYESHQDHVITGKAAAQAVISCSLTAYPEGTDTIPCQLNLVGFYFTSNPNLRVDITDYFDKKFEAVAIHKTQINDQLLAMYQAYFRMRGNRLSGCASIAEGLKILRPLHMHCFPEAVEI